VHTCSCVTEGEVVDARLEMFARIFALGFWRGPSAYLRDNYRKLDFLVVISSWALKIVAWEGIYQPIYPGALPLLQCPSDKKAPPPPGACTPPGTALTLRCLDF